MKAFKRRTLSHPLGTPVSMAPLEKEDHFQQVEAQGSEESTRAKLSPLYGSYKITLTEALYTLLGLYKSYL